MFMNRFLLTVFLFLSIIVSTDAQECPRHLYDCKGACGWFVDADGNGYCDLSSFSDALLKKLLNKKDTATVKQNINNSRIEDSIKKSDAAIQKTGLNNPGNKTQEPKTGNISHKCPFENTPECEKNIASQSGVNTSDSASNAQQTQSNSGFKIKKYDLFLIFSLCVFFYLLSAVLVKRKIYRKCTHRKIWNTLLLLAFLNTGLTGLFLVIQLNYLVLFNWFSKLLFWHVEFGISMAAISILHILWHWKYFWHLVVKRKDETACNS